MSKWIRKGDRVLIIAGNEKGKVGEVLSRKEEKVIIQGVNLRKKHVRRTQQAPGGCFVEMEMPVHISNLCLCDKEGTPLKVYLKKNEQGEKQLAYQMNGKEVIYRSIKNLGK